MNSSQSQFMDKQVTGSGSETNDMFNFLNPQNQQQQQEDEQQSHSGTKKEVKEEIVPSYDFQPIRPVGASQPINSGAGTRVSNSDYSITNSSHLRTCGSLDAIKSAKVISEKDLAAYNLSMVSEIDQTMEKLADKILPVLEGLGTRLSQLESRAHQLESLVGDLKVSVGNSHGKTDGKLRQLENILREVQTGVQVLGDKQDIAEAQLQLTKLQLSKGDQHSEIQTGISPTDSSHPVSATHQSLSPRHDVSQLPQQPPSFPPSNAPLSFQQIPPPVSAPHQSHPSLPPPHDVSQISQQPPSLPQPNSPHPSFQVPAPTQPSQSQMPTTPTREPYRGQLPEASQMQYQLPPAQQPHAPSPPHQHFPLPPQLSQYSQPPQQHLPVNPVNPSPQMQPAPNHHPEEALYLPVLSYPPRQLASMNQAPSMPPPSQQFHSAPHHMYEPSSGRTDSAYSLGYGPASGPNFADSYPYSGHANYGSSAMKPPQISSSSMPSGGSGFQHLPTAQILPRARPTSGSDGGPSSSSGNESKVAVDDIVEKVGLMGFSRDQVRDAVRKLIENGQSVDLNVVLDKLMNGGEVQPPKGWFGR